MGTVTLTELNRQVSAVTRRVVEHGETIRVTNRGRVVLRLVPEVEYSESPLDVLVAANLATSPSEAMRTITPGKKVQLSAPLDDILSEINADVEL